MSINYQELAKYVALSPALDTQEYFSTKYGKMTDYIYEGPLQVKERARKGKGGRFYTPPKTVKFEKSMTAWGLGVFAEPIPYPIRVHLSLHDHATDSDMILHSLAGLVQYDKGDIDNFGKSILDGLNGVAWKDDKQIVDLHIKRRYSARPGFRLSVGRAGLSKHEYTTLIRCVAKLENS